MFSLIALWDLWNYALKFSLRECPLFRAERGLGENWGGGLEIFSGKFG